MTKTPTATASATRSATPTVTQTPAASASPTRPAASKSPAATASTIAGTAGLLATSPSPEASASPLALSPTPTATAAPIPNLHPFPDAAGVISTFSTAGSIDTSNPFFQSLGTNGRSCSTCHVIGEGWTVSAAGVQDRFNATGGLDPIFRPVDGANAPNLDVSTLAARRAAYSMLLKKAVIRVGIGIPAGAEFSLAAVHDPYHFASANELSLFRRPLPATNLGFLSTIMWDGREPSLGSQANHATLGHAQGSGLSADQEAQIVAFESANFTAQTVEHAVGNLDSDGGKGGPATLSKQTFFIGINDPLGNNPSGAAFDPNAFTLYQAWADSPDPHKRAVAHGASLFNTRTFSITNVGGLPDTNQGTCTLCHNTFNVGDHSVAAPLNIGVADPGGHPGLDISGMPVYTLHCPSGDVQTTDPGRALSSGKCADIGKFKGPILRGLAARAPYFHNGSAASLNDVVTFYNSRFNIGFSSSEISDLVAFLNAL